ncbi:hypothetical protein CN558_29900 [Bacillus wiedmannii]|nr:hypothetical protein CN627_29735 [Bacillus wiedmannii]PEO77545.1 hypothetical protein CN558_29900 [Bacillus wiedmannii]
MELHGIQSIEPSEGMEVVRRLLNSDISQIIPIKAEERLLQTLGFTTKVKENNRIQIQKQSNHIFSHDRLTSGDTNVTASNNNISNETLDTKTKEYIKMILSNVLRIERFDIDEESTFENYGVDSVMSLEIKREFEKSFGKLSSTLLFENTNVKSLSEYFLVNHPTKLREILNVVSTVYEKETRASSEEKKEDVVIKTTVETINQTDQEMIQIIDRLSDKEIEQLFSRLLNTLK